MKTVTAVVGEQRIDTEQKIKGTCTGWQYLPIKSNGLVKAAHYNRRIPLALYPLAI
jgi:hypothetical protein